MKQPKKSPPRTTARIERFIRGAKTAESDQVPHATAGSKAKPAASGFQRTSFDLPMPLYDRLLLASAKTKLSKRRIVEQALSRLLDEQGF